MSADSAEFACATSARIAMRGYTPGDAEFVYGLATTEPTASRWRFGGRTPTTQRFAAALEAGITSHWIFVSKKNAARVGYACLYNYDAIDGVGYFAIVLAPHIWVSLLSFDCIIMSTDYIFRFWDIRLLYGEMNQHNYKSIESGEGRWFQRIGSLKSHQYVGRDYIDVVLVEIERDAWHKTIQRYHRVLHGRSDAADVQ